EALRSHGALAPVGEAPSERDRKTDRATHPTSRPRATTPADRSPAGQRIEDGRDSSTRVRSTPPAAIRDRRRVPPGSSGDSRGPAPRATDALSTDMPRLQ